MEVDVGVITPWILSTSAPHLHDVHTSFLHRSLLRDNWLEHLGSQLAYASGDLSRLDIYS